MDVLRFLVIFIILICTMVFWLPLALGLYLYDRFNSTSYYHHLQ